MTSFDINVLIVRKVNQINCYLHFKSDPFLSQFSIAFKLLFNVNVNHSKDLPNIWLSFTYIVLIYVSLNCAKIILKKIVYPIIRTKNEFLIDF